jgi:hypothetical protein
MSDTPKTIVSPDVIRSLTQDNQTDILIPMAEWKQAAIRGLRATIPAFIVLAGGGSAAEAATGAGIPPLLMVGLPTTGMFVVDVLIICLVIFVIWTGWNVVEFWMDLDTKAPQLRA